MYVQCNMCDKLEEHDLPNSEKKFKDEFAEYENIEFHCPSCGGIEIFNLNIPEDDTDEEFKTGDLPVEEEVQRFYVRTLMREVREDFVARHKDKIAKIKAHKMKNNKLPH